ncbi:MULTISPECIES: protein-disulfide reductase DsbD [Corallococcus]|uniref:protein-disulfide reductase DsbD family protein n=1 Tax=Corallococcus TaxID=83461 RepID=UPI00117F21CA|nr:MULTISPECIES: thioredoxin family protein [Corallococcus]NBD09772.1 thiol:disulfide interchange protein [Corallococcus silvisoli]TSC24000.1 thiol:disulfide interchange protein [Corallococcus sp. Z5C101001]
MTHPWSKRSGSRLGGLGVAGVLLLATVAQAALPSTAVGSTAPDEGDPRLEGALLLDATQVKAGGDFRVGVRLKLDPEWHVYWKNPGDSGLATEVSWDAPGVQVGDLRWPFPSTFRTPDGFITTHGYHDEVLLFAPAHVSEQAQGTLTVSAAVDALACKVHCIPAQLVLSRTLPVGPETVTDAEFAPLFDASQAQVPAPVGGQGAPRVALALDGTTLTAGKPFTGTLTVTAADGKPFAGGVEGDFFVPGRIAGVDRVALKQKAPGTFALEGQASSVVPKGEPRLTGALRLGTRATGFTAVDVDTALAPVVADGAVAEAAPLKLPSMKDAVGKVKPAAAAPVAAESSMGLGLALLFAFLGGALLNLMPCVFPVLAIKAYGFARLVQEEKGKVVPHALAYAGGIVATMLLLAGAVLAVRAGGSSVGWGFQFQEPLFVAGVSAVVVAFALNLFGVYTLGADGTALAGKVDQSHGLLRSAGEGVLAVVLATPCSAPLLGTAVGFAFAAGAATVVAVFLALGLGLALPFCVLVLVPGLAKRLPKPGMWMERGKQFLGFALLGTTVWLVWVMGGLAGVDGMARLLAFLIAVGLGTWLYGQSQGLEGGRRGVTVALAVLVLVGSGAVALRFDEAQASLETRGAVASSHGGAQPWDEAAVSAALAAGQPVFVDFTADWCLTCKFNERTVLSRDDVRQAFLKHNVAFFVADWTRRDARITTKLAEHGRAGVPMYLVLSPGAPDAPEVLNELLTADSVIQAVQRAAECGSPLKGGSVVCARH